MSNPRSLSKLQCRPDRTRSDRYAERLGRPGITQGCQQFSYRGKVWISTDTTPSCASRASRKEPLLRINHASFDSEYTRTGTFWLPAQNISVSHVRIGGEATLTIQYGEYHIDRKARRSQIASSARLESSLK